MRAPHHPHHHSRPLYILCSCGKTACQNYGYYFRQVIRLYKFSSATHNPPRPSLSCLLTTEIRAIKCVSELSTTMFPTLLAEIRVIIAISVIYISFPAFLRFSATINGAFNCDTVARRRPISHSLCARDTSYCIFYDSFGTPLQPDFNSVK